MKLSEIILPFNKKKMKYRIFLNRSASFKVLPLFCAASIQGRLLFKGGFYSKAASIQGRLLFKGCFYSRAASIQGRLLFKGCFYSRPASIQGRLLFKGGFYSRPASIQGRLLFKGGFYLHFCRFDVACISFYDGVALKMNLRILSIFLIPLHCKLGICFILFSKFLSIKLYTLSVLKFAQYYFSRTPGCANLTLRF